MDLDHVRLLLDWGAVRYSRKFDDMAAARGFTNDAAMSVIRFGRCIGEERRPKRPVKLVLSGAIERHPGVWQELVIEVAVTDEVVFISGYWPGDGFRRRVR